MEGGSERWKVRLANECPNCPSFGKELSVTSKDFLLPYNIQYILGPLRRSQKLANGISGEVKTVIKVAVLWWWKAAAVCHIAHQPGQESLGSIVQPWKTYSSRKSWVKINVAWLLHLDKTKRTGCGSSCQRLLSSRNHCRVWKFWEELKSGLCDAGGICDWDKQTASSILQMPPWTWARWKGTWNTCPKEARFSETVEDY